MRLNLIKHLKLIDLSEGEESGIPSVAVKYVGGKRCPELLGVKRAQVV